MQRRTTTTWSIPLTLGVFLCLALGPAAINVQAQDQPPEPDVGERGKRARRDRGLHRSDRPKHRRCGEGDERPGGRRGGRHELRKLFRPAREDMGPLRPGEEEELREFARSELPQLNLVLERLEQRSPRALRHSLRDLVPHLRHLRRVHERDPEMAGLIDRHAGNLFHIRMLRRVWWRVPEERRAEIERRLRRHVADNTRVQIEAMRLWADQLEAARNARIGGRLETLRQPGADLTEEPPRVRKQVRELWSVSDDARRAELEAELADHFAEQFDREVAELRRRAGEMETRQEEEVDQRIRWILESPRPHGPKP